MNTTTVEMSLPEKQILADLVPEAAPLPYPTRRMRMPKGYKSEMEYIIPESDRKLILESLYPFQECPGLDDELFDLHMNKRFRVRDYRVIRHDGRNLLVSPYYPQKGGMVVDWVANMDEVDCKLFSSGLKAAIFSKNPRPRKG